MTEFASLVAIVKYVTYNVAL